MKLKKTILNRLVFSNTSVPILAIRPYIAWMMALLLVTLPANAQDTPADILADPALDLKRPAAWMARESSQACGMPVNPSVPSLQPATQKPSK